MILAEPEANVNESLELDVEPDFNSHQVQKSFRGHLRPPPLRSPGPWAFNNRGGPRPPPPHRHHPRDEEFYRDGPHDGNEGFVNKIITLIYLLWKLFYLIISSNL